MEKQRKYSRLGNAELDLLNDLTAYALDLQSLARAVAELSDDPVALRYAKRSHERAQEMQAMILEYQARRYKETKG